MNDLVDHLGLGPILDRAGISHAARNFEEVYSELFAQPKFVAIRSELEERIYSYFQALALPPPPNLYDHLVLSLRQKDVIATFNWDPFLIHAYCRNSRSFKLRRLLFLHGNVAVGYCRGHKVKVPGLVGKRCRRCDKPLIRSRLLYPIADKNYEADGFIKGQRRELKRHMKIAFMLTIFGYGAPKTDAAAIRLLKRG